MTHWAYCCCDRDPPANDLYLFDPCEPNCDSFQMAATIATWTGLGVSIGPTYLFTPQTIECCKEKDADPPTCVRFCGTLRLATEGEITKFCTEGVSCSSCPPTGVIQVIDASYSGGSFSQISPLYDCATAPCSGCRPVQCDSNTYLKLSILKTYRLYYKGKVLNGTTPPYSDGSCTAKTTATDIEACYDLEFSVQFDAYLEVNARELQYNATPPSEAWLAAILSRHQTCSADCININTVTVNKNSFYSRGSLTDETLQNDGSTFVTNVTQSWNQSGTITVPTDEITIDTVKIQKVDALYENAFDKREDYTPNPAAVCSEAEDCLFTYFCPMEFKLGATGTFSKSESNFNTDCTSFDDDFSESGSINTSELAASADMGKVGPALEFCCCGDDPSSGFRLKTVKASNGYGGGSGATNIESLVRTLLSPNTFIQTGDITITVSEGLNVWDWTKIYTILTTGIIGDLNLFQDDSNTPDSYSFGSNGRAYLNDTEDVDFDCDPNTSEPNFSVNFNVVGVGGDTNSPFVGLSKTVDFEASISDTITSWECVTQSDLPGACCG